MNTWMQEAFFEALKAVGISRPNPPVGAVVIKDGKIIGKGHTQEPGNSHAEVMALKNAGAAAQGATLYVTLEPCCHFGRTPPCTNAIIESGIKRVFFAHQDPNPVVRGKSRAILNDAGIHVFEGAETCSLEVYEHIEHFYEAYDYFVKNNSIFVELKSAMTKNKMIARKDKSPLKITSIKANRWNHELRAMSDAILIGSSTLCHDNPGLDTRLAQGNSPVKIILGFNRTLTQKEVAKFNIFKTGRVIFFSQIDQPHVQECSAVTFIPLKSSDFKENWKQVLNHLNSLKMHRVLVEPGAFLAQKIYATKLWNRYYLWESNANCDEGLKFPVIAPFKPFKIFEDETLYTLKNERIEILA